MINIFNLFLFLFASWVLFMVAGGHFSLFYVLYGIVACALVAYLSLRLRLVEKNSELLYLSSGFYSHFLLIYLKNFISSMKIIIVMALKNTQIRPLIYAVNLNSEEKFNPALLMVSFNMSAGLLSIDFKENKILVHALDEKYFERFNVKEIVTSLKNTNDDNLI